MSVCACVTGQPSQQQLPLTFPQVCSLIPLVRPTVHPQIPCQVEEESQVILLPLLIHQFVIDGIRHYYSVCCLTAELVVICEIVHSVVLTPPALPLQLYLLAPANLVQNMFCSVHFSTVSSSSNPFFFTSSYPCFPCFSISSITPTRGTGLSWATSNIPPPTPAPPNCPTSALTWGFAGNC